LCLAFYTTLFFLVALSSRTELPEWTAVFAGMALVYGTAFFAVASEWFWGRWFGTGIGYWGLTVTGMAVVTSRSLPTPLVIFGVMHALVVLCLAGERMAGAFEAKPGWRERWKLDEHGVVRVRRSVTRAASSLPALIMFALAPRESAGLGLALGVLAVVGLSGLLQFRTWGVLVVGATGLLAAGAALGMLDAPALVDPALAVYADQAPLLLTPSLLLGFAALALCAAVVPFARPLAAYLRR
jgi:hypothetical protein